MSGGETAAGGPGPAAGAPVDSLLAGAPRIINLGLASFARDLEARGAEVLHVQWAPPAGGDERLRRLLAVLDDGAAVPGTTRTEPPGGGGDRRTIGEANRDVLERLVGAEPVLEDCAPAREVIGLADRAVLHAGPPLDWARACPTMQAAICCAIRYEGWADDDAAARRLVEQGEVALRPCHDAGAVGPMTGIVTPSMPLLVVEDRAGGRRAHAAINEGLGRVLRFGANDAQVVERLHWLAREAGPLLGRALRRGGGVELGPLMAQALRMGDEMHQRNIAASSLLLRRLAPQLARAAVDGVAAARVLEFVAANDQFFLNLAMAAGKVAAEACRDVAGATMVTAMARNGTDFGIRVAGLGDRWFTAPVQTPEGLYFPGFGPDDANPDMGDSAIVETVGLGAFAMAASPAVAGFVGAGGLADAVRITEEMSEICLGEHPRFRMPTLDDRGTPVGIDVRRVVETGIAPLINTGIAGRRPGTGQIGAGIARAPLACFEQALSALAEAMDR